MKSLAPIAVLLAVVLPLAACNNEANGVRISTEKAAPPPVAIKARSEPVFYNGKTYQLDLSPAAGGHFDMAVAGMTAKQEKDAVAVATSSLRYFACPDGKSGQLSSKPAYTAGAWKMRARCV